MMINSIECVRKSFKWYKKFFFHLLDITLLNSHALYKVKTRKNVTLADFQLALIREIFQNFHTPRSTSKSGRSVSGDQPRRLTERHFPIPVPPTPSKAKPARKCHVCANTTKGPQKRKDNKVMCAQCDVSLCLNPCFSIYHTGRILNYCGKWRFHKIFLIKINLFLLYGNILNWKKISKH
jgi:hypothetical protein